MLIEALFNASFSGEKIMIIKKTETDDLIKMEPMFGTFFAIISTLCVEVATQRTFTGDAAWLFAGVMYTCFMLYQFQRTFVLRTSVDLLHTEIDSESGKILLWEHTHATEEQMEKFEKRFWIEFLTPLLTVASLYFFFR